MGEMGNLRREQIREARREEIKELNKMRREEKGEEDDIEVILVKIRIEIKNLIKLQEHNLGKVESQMRIYPKGNEALHELEARKQIIEEDINKLKDLFHISGKLGEELKSKHLLPVEVCEMFKKELENAIAIFKELMLRRRKKILSMGFVASETGISKRDFDNLSGFEKELFDDIVQSLKKAEKALDDLRQGKVQLTNHILIRFMEKVESFVGLDGNSLGPFEKGDIANLEKEIVEILVQDKKAEILEA